MIDAFEKESKLHERRAARQRQMRLMEEAASGVPSSLSSPNGADNVLDSGAGVGRVSKELLSMYFKEVKIDTKIA